MSMVRAAALALALLLAGPATAEDGPWTKYAPKENPYARYAPAKLVIMGGQQPTVISYPTMTRCLAAKAAILKQAWEKAEADKQRSGMVMLSGPTVYCVPG